jgi:hypothetical protein
VKPAMIRLLLGFFAGWVASFFAFRALGAAYRVQQVALG